MTATTAPPATQDGLVAERAARIILRPIANPLPLGFLALATASLLMSGLQFGWLKPTDGQAVAIVLLAFVAPLQLLASIFGFLGRDVVAGTGMGILAGTWLATSLIMRQLPPGGTSDALGLFLVMAGVAMVLPAIGSSLGKLVATAVLAVTALRFAANGIYQLSDSNAWRELSAAIGAVLCVIAIYAALAMLLEDVRRGTVLPTFRRGRGKSSVEGNLHDQLAQIEHEAGVREQL